MSLGKENHSFIHWIFIIIMLFYYLFFVRVSCIFMRWLRFVHLFHLPARGSSFVCCNINKMRGFDSKEWKCLRKNAHRAFLKESHVVMLFFLYSVLLLLILCGCCKIWAHACCLRIHIFHVFFKVLPKKVGRNE